jgi:hypothetical protein
MTTSENLGNQLNRIVYYARAALFDQGEVAQLTYVAFEGIVGTLKDEEITIRFPVGYRPDAVPMPGERKYKKEDLVNRYAWLAHYQLTVNSLLQLVTIVESMLNDLVRAIVQRYPRKLGSKRTVPIESVLDAATLEEVQLKATDSLINELSYKSPREFAGEFECFSSINLLECAAFHRYIEVKASRDIYVHNRGIANSVYLRKTESHARVGEGVQLPADIPYLLESYEYCLQLTEWLEAQLHEHWHSTELENRRAASTTPSSAQPAGPALQDLSQTASTPSP